MLENKYIYIDVPIVKQKFFFVNSFFPFTSVPKIRSSKLGRRPSDDMPSSKGLGRAWLHVRRFNIQSFVS
jgi:hypothetical protein